MPPEVVTLRLQEFSRLEIHTERDRVSFAVYMTIAPSTYLIVVKIGTF